MLNLIAVLKRSHEKGIRLNAEKLEVSLSQISYFGHVISEQGLSPDPAKISAIRDMPSPENRSQLETVLGMVTYLSRFAPNLISSGHSALARITCQGRGILLG
jgi:DNA-binding GntR family transcriptional regulator